MKKLIIVCEEKRRQYGDFLSQLVSLSDDKNDKLLGVQGGLVTAQVWTEKEYFKDSRQISSEQYILFIGDTKQIKDKRSHMMTKYSQYGMQYGWLGKQAALFVEKVVDLKEYDNFIEYAKDNQSDVTRLIELKSDIIVVHENTKDVESKGKMKILDSVKTLTANVANAPIRGLNAFNKLTNNKKIEEQEYSCLVLVFYMNGLSRFLGLCEE